METFTKVKEFVNNLGYYKQRQKQLNALDMDSIDGPIVKMIEGFSKLPYCFTLQSCYGHFLYEGRRDPYNTGPLPKSDIIKTVDYKIAYMAICIQNNKQGEELLEGLSRIPQIDHEFIQFGCAEWFWAAYPNSFVLQVEPERYSAKDRVSIEYKEALKIEAARNKFFKELNDLIKAELLKRKR